MCVNRECAPKDFHVHACKYRRGPESSKLFIAEVQLAGIGHRKAQRAQRHGLQPQDGHARQHAHPCPDRPVDQDKIMLRVLILCAFALLCVAPNPCTAGARSWPSVDGVPWLQAVHCDAALALRAPTAARAAQLERPGLASASVCRVSTRL